MNYFVNDAPRHVREAMNLETLLLAEGLGQGEPIRLPQGLAVAVNQQVIPRAHWAEMAVAAGDRIDIFSVIAGG